MLGNNIALGKAAEDSRTPKPCGMAMRSSKRASVLECGSPPLLSLMPATVIDSFDRTRPVFTLLGRLAS
jgi:hypothetical protein